MSQFRNPEISHLEGELAFRHSQRQMAMDAEQTKHDPKTGQFTSGSGAESLAGHLQSKGHKPLHEGDKPENPHNTPTRHGFYREKMPSSEGGSSFYHKNGEKVYVTKGGGWVHSNPITKDEHLGWTKMVQHLEGEGKSKESAEKIAGAINAKKNG